MSDRVVLITGASRGIGAATALAFAEPGTRLWLNYASSDDAAAEVAAACEEQGAAVDLLKFDVGDRDAVAELVVKKVAAEGPVDVLVNNAGITRDTLFAWVTPADWDEVIRVNLGGLYSMTHAVVKGMVRKRRGRIINLTSVSGQRGNGGQTPYSATKAGIIGFSKSLALELASRQITVNAVSPGLIDTDMTSSLPREDLTKAIPMRRFGTAEEVAHVIRFLASAEASYITGQVIAVNGGLYT